ncbi:hypothetical protein [Noviherbaspirillum saxi]|uniref:Uncharacterized protein n=1 Tax=Noviherbaspirillum saxi TaxID=2320863 RepID=A0A3A3FND4_9BURK|nr:hypothetical protein [Noviherbaspirillum saxi]RJF95179.1 hypothetical protein D3871_17150 [Noviherbaspirillum saxi]
MTETGSGTVEITPIPAAPRRIAGIVLPVLQMRFRFIGMAQEQRDEFLAYFDRYTQRGGG